MKFDIILIFDFDNFDYCYCIKFDLWYMRYELNWVERKENMI